MTSSRPTSRRRSTPIPALKDVTVASVNKGVVLLGGTVETLEAHVQAVDTASKVRGVRRVSTNITTKADTE